MRITRIEAHGVGPFDNATLDIPAPERSEEGELVLFEGPNGSGKTTLAQAIALSAVVMTYQAGAGAVPDWYAAFSRRFRRDGRMVVHLEHDHQRLRTSLSPDGRRENVPDVEHFQVTLGPGGLRAEPNPFDLMNALGLKDEPLTQVHWAAHLFQGNQATPSTQAPGPQDLGPPSFTHVLPFARHDIPAPLGQFLTNLDYERVRADSYARQADRPEEERERLQETSRSHDQALSRLQQALSDVLGRKIRFQFDPGRPTPRLLFDGEEIPLDLLGEGMRSTLAWLADLLIRLERTPWARTDRSSLDQDFWLILDEVEVNMHPQMQRRIFPALRKLFPRARIYATTHSPFAVAALDAGQIFSIDPDPKSHHVTGPQPPRPLAPGQSLEWVVSEIFDTPSMFQDEGTRAALSRHDQELQRLRAGGEIDWAAFLQNRQHLMALNEEVQMVVAMREVPLHEIIASKQRELQG